MVVQRLLMFFCETNIYCRRHNASSSTNKLNIYDFTDDNILGTNSDNNTSDVLLRLHRYQVQQVSYSA